MTSMDPQFKPVADHALLVQFGTAISKDVSARVQMLDRAMSGANLDGVRETIPAFVNLLVEFDPLVTDHDTLADSIVGLLHKDGGAPQSVTRREVLVCYDEEFAPDLGGVAKARDLSIDAVIGMHLAGEYHVGMYGFAPGYAYLAGVPEALQVPRKPTAIRDVSAGSVLIAGPQCLVTTLKMPTGWSIIGRSPTKILRDDPERPFLFDVGDVVRFKRIDRTTFERLNSGGGA